MPITTHKFGAGAKPDIGKNDATLYLGGKGAHLAVMSGLGVPVPPGLTIPTKHCVEFMSAKAGTQATMLKDARQVALEGLAWLKEITGYLPLVSVRSGAPVSMPGMMDTILNVGMTDAVLPEWAQRLGPWAAVDSYRRLMQMLGCTAMGLEHHAFDQHMIAARKKDGVELDKDISLATLAEVVDAFRYVWKTQAKVEFPQDVGDQLELAIGAVWKSWANPRAATYRDQYKIDHTMGTAVTVQAMVFGNMNDDSGSGVMFTRNPMTGENAVVGEFLPCAQGEDVVAGIRTPLPISDMQQSWPEVTQELLTLADKLEQHYCDMQDIEFTVQDKKLFLLQTRSAKRSALAAVKIGAGMVAEKLIEPSALLTRLTAQQLLTAKRPIVSPKTKNAVLATGLSACPGVGIGCIATTSAEAVKLASQGYDVILVTPETTPDDIAGMIASKGILTSTGGATSHAAVVARALDKPCIVGCGDLTFPAGKSVKIGDTLLTTGTQTTISVDGLSGKIFKDAVEVLDASDDPALRMIETMILEQDGVLLRTDGGLCSKEGALSGYVIAAAWQDDPAAGAAMFTNQLLAKGAKVDKVFLDMTPPSKLTYASDDLLMKVIGTGTLADREKAWTQAILQTLLAAPTLVGVVVLNPDTVVSAEVKALRDKGAKFVREATNVADLMSNDSVIVTQEFIAGVIGDADAWSDLKNWLESQGKLTGFEAPKHATVEEAAFRVLA